MRRGSEEPQLTVIRWRDIPAQVIARGGGSRATAQLPDRFQVAIDQAAARAAKTDADDYLAEWREERRPCGPDLEAEVQAEAGRLEAELDDGRLATLVGNGGWAF